MRRLNVKQIATLSNPIDSNAIVDAMPGAVRRWVKTRFDEGGLITPKSFIHVVDTVIELAPETANLLNRFSLEVRTRIARLSEKEKLSLAFQKESIATALNISGMDRSSLSEWRPDRIDEPASFLDGLSEARLREDPMIVNDMMNVPGYDLIRTLPVASAAKFTDGSTSLTVILANRQELENQTGTDLIYYNETFKAFVMVQYKAMGAHDEFGAAFRFPEDQLTKEIERMEAMLVELAKVPSAGHRNEFRLNDNPFYLKFCPRLQFDPYGTGLTSGMYLPLGYWKLTENDPAMVGPRGGKRIAYQNAGRHLDNSGFATLVSRAWIGTSVTQSKALEKWIADLLETGKAVTFAVKKDEGDGGAGVPVPNPLIDLEGVAEEEGTPVQVQILN